MRSERRISVRIEEDISETDSRNSCFQRRLTRPTYWAWKSKMFTLEEMSVELQMDPKGQKRNKGRLDQ